jgi:hypothetical protein
MERDEADSERQDKRLTCVRCLASSWFTVGERTFYRSRSLSEPRRCPRSRALARPSAGVSASPRLPLAERRVEAHTQGSRQ